MAPERFTRGADDGRTDVYALGCTVYEMLTGAPPFDSSAPALMHSHVYETPEKPSVRRPGLAPGWDELVGRMLAKPVEEQADGGGGAGGIRETGPARAASPAPAQLADHTPPLGQDSPPPPHREPRPTSRPIRSTPHLTQPRSNSPRAPQPSAPTPPRTCSRRRSRSSRPLPRPLVRAGGACMVDRRLRGRHRARCSACSSVVQPFRGGDDGDKGSGKNGCPAGREGRHPGTVAPVAKTQTLTLGSDADAKGPAPAVAGRHQGRQGHGPRTGRLSPPSTRATCGPGPTG